MKKEEFNEMVAIIEEETNTVAVEVEYPDVGSDQWYDFVVDNLSENELVEGNPTVDGLRRFTERFFGYILKSKSELLDIGGYGCTMKHTLVVRRHGTLEPIEVDGCVSVETNSLPHPYNKHIVATADTRAEGKALRRLLKIRAVTADELPIADGEEDVLSSKDPVTDQQITCINAMCRKHKINVEKVTKSVYNHVKSIKQLSVSDASDLIDTITSYQRDGVPEELLGYKEGWQSSF